MRRVAPPTRRLTIAAAAVMLLPRSTRAQKTKRRIGFLSFGSRTLVEPYYATFRQGLRVLGYCDENLDIEERYADGRTEHLAAELVRLAPELIVAGSPGAAHAAKQATATIPIVIAAIGDPVAAGFVASLARPGGNITGLSLVSQDLAGKWLELLKIAVPGAERVAILVNPDNPFSAVMLPAARQAAGSLRMECLSVEARSPGEIDGAFAIMTRQRADALIIQGDSVLLSERSRIVELAARHKLPAIYQFREFILAGGLMCYGPELNDLFRRAATYVDKILKGAKPADLPVEQPTKFQLVINLKTAQALGLTVPQSLLLRADEVIE